MTVFGVGDCEVVFFGLGGWQQAAEGGEVGGHFGQGGGGLREGWHVGGWWTDGGIGRRGLG